MRVLVTGGHGFVGSHLVERLLASGDRVRCLNRRAEVPERLRVPGVEVVAGDLATGLGLEAAVAGMDEVWHLGALTRSRTRREMLAVNTQGTLRLARAAERAGLPGRFVLCSSIAAVGPSADGTPLDEQAPLHPVTTYGESKRRAEEGLVALGRAGGARGPGLAWTIVRPPAVYGPRDRDFLGLFRAAARGFLPIVGAPSRRLSLIHATDLAEGLLAAGRSPATLRQAWFVTGPEVSTQGELAECLAQAVGRRGRRFVLPVSALRALAHVSALFGQVTPRPPLLTPERVREVGEGHWVCSGEGLARATGWRATTGLAAGLAATAAWYRAEGLL